MRKQGTLLAVLLILFLACTGAGMAVGHIGFQTKSREETTEERMETELPVTAGEDSTSTEMEDSMSTEEADSFAPSGFVVCIDPGHYKGASYLTGDHLYGYEEGIFTLQLSLALQEELACYGIDSYLTRETDSITINGYTNGELDHTRISLRGECARDADLFVSIHTNANQENANGYQTFQQPMEINKTIVIVNEIAAESDWAIHMANEIGLAVTKVSYEKGLSFTGGFETVDKETLREWTDSYNDKLQALGTVCYRKRSKGDDYYGVLRGATNVGVAGMIIEHGFHSVEDMRRQAMNGDLADAWAKADAYAIARGFGIIDEM